MDGENLAAAPIERLLHRYQPFGPVAVYAVPDPHVGDQVMAAVEMTGGAAFDPAAFAAYFAAQPDLGHEMAAAVRGVTPSMPHRDQRGPQAATAGRGPGAGGAVSKNGPSPGRPAGSSGSPS